IIGDVLEPLDTRRRRQFDVLASEGPFAANRTSRSPAATMTTMPSSSIFNNCSASGRLLIRYVSDRKSLEIKSLEMVDQTGTSWNRIASWLIRVDVLRRAA